MNKIEIIQGTPIEAGAEAFVRFMLPLLVAAQDRPDEELALFYGGIIMAALGSMAADFGHDQAVNIADQLVSHFRTTPPPAGHSH